jgi:hypothetical protein
MERGAGGAHYGATLNPLLLEEASELNTLLQEGPDGGGEEAGETDAAAAAAARPLAAITHVGEGVARCVVARWRALVAVRKGVTLLRLLALPDLFEQEVLKWLDPTSLIMLAQAGRPWLAAVLTSGFSRLPTEFKTLLRLQEFCTSAERLAWAKAIWCP